MILGCCLLSPEVVAEVATGLKERDFFLPSHQHIYRAMLALVSQGLEALEPVSLQEELRQRGELDRVGGAAYIASLFDGVPRFSTVENYTRIVRDKAAKRALIHAANAMMAAAFDDDDGAPELLSKARQQINQIEDPTSRDNWSNFGETLALTLERMDEYQASDRYIQGFATGFETLDFRTGGLPIGQVTIVSARPGMGKTAFVTDLMIRAARHTDNGGKTIAAFSMEMSREEISKRVLFSGSGVSSDRWRRKLMNSDDWRALGSVVMRDGNLPIELDDSSTLTPNQMRSALRKLERRSGPIGAVVLDYLQFMSGDGKRYENRTSEITDVSRHIKAIAKEFKVSMISVASMNRGPDNRTDGRPNLSDLRESGQIESDAAVVLFPHRPAYKEQMQGRSAPSLKEEAELIIAKGRDVGTGIVKMYFSPHLTRWQDGTEI